MTGFGKLRFFSHFWIFFPVHFVALQSLNLVETFHASSHLQFSGPLFFFLISKYFPKNIDFYMLPVIFAFCYHAAIRFG